MIGVKLFLLGFVLNEFQAIRIRVYFFPLSTKIAQGFYVDCFNLDTYGIAICSKSHDGIVILERTHGELIGAKLPGCIGTGVQHFGFDIKFSGGVEHHFAQLTAA